MLGKSVLTNGFAQLIATCARLCLGSSGPGVGLVSHRRLETATVSISEAALDRFAVGAANEESFGRLWHPTRGH